MLLDETGRAAPRKEWLKIAREKAFRGIDAQYKLNTLVEFAWCHLKRGMHSIDPEELELW